MKDMYSPFFNLVYLSLFAESYTRNSRSPVPRKKTISLSLFDLNESALAEDLLFSLLEHPSLGILDQASHLRPSLGIKTVENSLTRQEKHIFLQSLTADSKAADSGHSSVALTLTRLISFTGQKERAFSCPER